MAPPAGSDPDYRPILAIDTSSSQGSVALFDGRRLSVRSWPAERSHTTTLLREIHHLLDAEGLNPREVAAIAVAIGPGAFTGLRVGLGTAKGFHLATGVPLIGVSTLEATALPFALCGRPIVAAVAAGRGRLVWSRFNADGVNVIESHPPRNGTAVELAESISSRSGFIVTGEIDDDQVDVITTAKGISVPPRALRSRQPSALAEIGWRRWRAGRCDDPTALEPVYSSR